MIKRFPDGTAKPFLTPREYAELRDDDRFLYNEGADPSARITGDKGRENPAEGAPYGEGLIGRITALEAREAELVHILEAITAMQALRYGDATRTHIALIGLCVTARATLAKACQSDEGE